ncbi:hypothetical protein K502DRAFT_323999 [Neoconidiobolus thromboides FSU 785]|nr:hypothetical protein K502DRAFT_323999 [Neoconidiobolus thromboides FSU 785]
MSLKPSRFMSPDVSEFWNGNFTTLSFEITEAQFNKMRLKVETDKKKQMHLYQVI